MTIQNLFTADLSDVLHVQLTCGKCGAQASYDPDGRTEVAGVCPQCRETWKDPHLIDEGIVAVERFLETLKTLRGVPRETGKRKRVGVRLVFDLGKKD